MVVRIAIAQFLVNADDVKKHHPELHAPIDDMYISRAGEIQGLIVKAVTK